MKTLKLILVMMAMALFVMNPFLVGLAAADSVKLESGVVMELSQAQVDNIKSHPGVFYSTANPELLPGQSVVALPVELGGGYVFGSPEALAQSFTDAGAAIGATSSTIAPAALTIPIIAVFTAGVAAITIQAVADASADTTVAHP